MSDYDYSQLKSESLVIVIASTFGNGDPPENGRGFYESLLNSSSEEGGKQKNELTLATLPAIK